MYEVNNITDFGQTKDKNFNPLVRYLSNVPTYYASNKHNNLWSRPFKGKYCNKPEARIVLYLFIYFIYSFICIHFIYLFQIMNAAILLVPGLNEN